MAQTLRVSVELEIVPTTYATQNMALPTRRKMVFAHDFHCRSVYMDGPHELTLLKPSKAYEVNNLDPDRMHLLVVIMDNDAGNLEGVDTAKRYFVMSEPPEVDYDITQSATEKFLVSLKDTERIDYSELSDGLFGLPDDVGIQFSNALTVSTSRIAATSGSFITRGQTMAATVTEPFLLFAELEEKPVDIVRQWEERTNW